MAFLPSITYVNEAGGATIMVVSGCYSPPSLSHFVWLGEAGEAFTEWKVEKISHFYAANETINPITDLVDESTDGTMTIAVSEVLP